MRVPLTRSGSLRSAFLLAPLLAIALAGCGGSGSQAPADPKLSLVTVLSTQTHLIGGDVTVVGTVKNGDTSEHDISMHASFSDTSGKEIGTGDGVAEDVPPGGTGSFEIDGKVDPAKYATTQVTVTSLNEQK